MKYVIAIILAFCGVAHAGQWGIQVHLHSMHFADRAFEDWNETTGGIGLRYAFNDTYAVQVGRYRNEYTLHGHNFDSTYALGDWLPKVYGPLRVGVYTGLVTGYPDYTMAPSMAPGRYVVTSVSHDGLYPMVGLVARADYRKFNLTLRLQPDISHAGPAHLATEVGYSF